MFRTLRKKARNIRKSLQKRWKEFKSKRKKALRSKQRAAEAAALERRALEAAARRRRELVERVSTVSPLNIVVGASGVFEQGWIPTDIDDLNLLHQADWDRYFKTDSVNAILAEHVWEHLTIEDGLTAAQNCHRYLRPGGYLRIAVPDGLKPDPDYIEYVRVGGSGAGASDHKVLYTVHSLTMLLSRAGFDTQVLEHYDDDGGFHAVDWDPASGMIHRSKRFDERNAGGVLRYTSLIVDGIKRQR